MGKKSIVSGALILTAAGIITRLLGFVYRIYMSNIIGAEGMGLYQLIIPLYGLAWSLACSGFTTTVSRLTAQEKARGAYGNVGRILKQSVLATCALGLLVGGAMYCFAPQISAVFLQDSRTLLSIRILSIAIPFMSAGSCMRGYFLGMQETLIPAVNQVFEQCIRMLVIYLLAGFFIPLGLEYACAAAVIGIVCEEIFSLLYIIVAYRVFKTKNMLNKRPTLSSRASFGLILSMALPLTGNRVSGALLTTLENTLIPQRLILFGMTHNQAMGVFGQISGMAMPLVAFPTALLNALATSLMPAISEASALNNTKRIHYTVSKAMAFSTIIGAGAGGLFVALAKPLGTVIYNQNLTEMLILMGLMCPFIYMQVVLSGVLNGLGYQMFIFRNSLISSFINVAFIYFLVPRYGVKGFMLGWIVSLVVVCYLDINRLRSSIQLRMDLMNWFVKPFVCALASALVGRLVFIYGQPYFGAPLALGAAACLLIGLYLLLALLTGCLEKEDIMRFIPKKAVFAKKFDKIF